MGADPIVPVVAALSHQQGGPPVAGFLVRKEPKKHGTRKYLEGYQGQAGDPVVIVDDVCTTGGSLFHAIEAAEAVGCTVVKVVSLLDRNEGGSEEMRRRGYDFSALLAAKPDGKIEPVSG